MNWILILMAGAVLVSGPGLAQEINTNPPTKVVSAAAAELFVGETNTVIGKVAQVTLREKVVYLNLEKPFPDMLCSGVIFAAKTNQFENLEKLKGRTILITGKITEYQGKPQIVIDGKNQLEVVTELGAESSESAGNAPKDSERQEPALPATPGGNVEKALALRQEIANLQITNQAKDLLLERLQKDREHFDLERHQYVEQLMNFSREVGDLETKLQQVEGPARSDRNTNAGPATTPSK